MTPWTIQFMEFSRPEYWTGWPFSSPGNLPNPGMEHWYPIFQAGSLPSEPSGRPKNTGVGSLSLRGSSHPRNQTGVSSFAGRFFTSWAITGAYISIYLTSLSIHQLLGTFMSWQSYIMLLWSLECIYLIEFVFLVIYIPEYYFEHLFTCLLATCIFSLDKNVCSGLLLNF